MSVKLVYEISLLVSIVILAGCVLHSLKKKKEQVKLVRELLLIGIFNMAAGLVTVVSDSYLVCKVAYSAYFAGIDWMLCWLLYFVIQYAGYDTKKYIRKLPFFIISCLDASMLYSNVFTEKVVAIKEIVLSNGETYYSFAAKPLFYVHLCLDYLLLALVFGCLIERICRVPKHYRIKYVVVFVTLFAVVLLNAVYLYQSSVIEIDISLIFYALAGIGMYLGTVVFVPGKLLEQLLASVVQDMMASVFMLDIDGNCVYANEGAVRLLDIREGDRGEDNSTIQQWLGGNRPEEYCNYLIQKKFEKNGKEYHLKTQFQRLEDDKGRYQGCFFLIHDITVEIDRLEEQSYLASHDSLTGLYNRETFFEQVEKVLFENPGVKYLMICSDIHNFKLVNDVFGERVGDEVLRSVARQLRLEAVEGEIYGRISEDRFALLMPKERYQEDLFVNSSSKIHIMTEKAYQLIINVGVYEIDDRTLPVQVMCDRAFLAINSIKDDYSVRVAHYDNVLRDGVLLEQHLSGELERAIKDGQIRLYLQPQISTDGRVIGSEALVRWQHPERGLLMPGVFIPIFEKNGMVAQLDLFMWEEACRLLCKWKAEGREEYYISVNISPKDLYYLDVYEIFTGLVKKYDIPPKMLKLEITESAVMMNLKRQLDLIARLQNAGFVIEMDDFGSGYSSLNMLKQIKVDILKIDKEFLRASDDDERGKIILQMTIQMAKALGALVVVEGVEREEQAEFLRGIGSDVFQGFLFAKPMPVSEFEERYFK